MRALTVTIEWKVTCREIQGKIQPGDLTGDPAGRSNGRFQLGDLTGDPTGRYSGEIQPGDPDYSAGPRLNLPWWRACSVWLRPVLLSGLLAALSAAFVPMP